MRGTTSFIFLVVRICTCAWQVPVFLKVYPTYMIELHMVHALAVAEQPCMQMCAPSHMPATATPMPALCSVPQSINATVDPICNKTMRGRGVRGAFRVHLGMYVSLALQFPTLFRFPWAFVSPMNIS